jgi:solute:Na+ symporter, SSS family
VLDLLLNPYIAAILVYLVALVAVGVYKSRGISGSADFMVAGRSLPWYILVGTLLATWIGNGSLFAGAGLGYRNGFAGAWSSAGAWLGIMFVYFIAKRIRHFGKVTVPDIFEARYNSTAGVLATITTIIAYLTIVSYQFRGGGRILSIITDGGISVEAGIVVTALVRHHLHRPGGDGERRLHGRGERHPDDAGDRRRAGVPAHFRRGRR